MIYAYIFLNKGLYKCIIKIYISLLMKIKMTIVTFHNGEFEI